jgi:hypothetical protein
MLSKQPTLLPPHAVPAFARPASRCKPSVSWLIGLLGSILMLDASRRLLSAPFGDASVIEGATTSGAATRDSELVPALRLPTPLNALTAIAPMLSPNSIEKNPIRNSRRKRELGANQPNSG